jgi:hypothetical protein
MSDYSDLCEMYGRNPIDPDFIDDLIDEINIKNNSEEYLWILENGERSHCNILDLHLDSVETLCEQEIPGHACFSLKVMMYGHVVSAIEGYLSSVFINVVSNSNSLTRKLVETDPEFSKRTFSMKDIFTEHSSLKITVASYLKGLIFHDLKKIKPMYNSVLGHDFGNISWFFKAVQLRHDCVHRAGFDKEGNKIEVTTECILQLIKNIRSLVTEIEKTLNRVGQETLFE